MKSVDMVSINHEILASELVDSYKGDKSPLFIWGMPGIGKSQVIADTFEKHAHDMGMLYVDWNRVSRPFKHALAADRSSTAYAKDPGWLKRLAEEEIEVTDDEGAKVTRSRTLRELTDIVEGLAESGTIHGAELRKACFMFMDVRLSQRDPSDINGLPRLDTKDCVEWLPVLMFKALSQKNTQAVLLFDELPQAIPVVQNAAYQLIHDRCCGELSFSDGVFVIAAGNRITDGGSSFTLAPALANRFAHYELRPPTVEEWVRWGIVKQVDSRVVCFLQWKGGEALTANMENVRRNRQMAWASPRAWKKVSSKIAGVFTRPDMNDADALKTVERRTASCVGSALAVEFNAFLKNIQTLDLEKIMENPEMVKKFQIDQTWALISALTEYYKTGGSLKGEKGRKKPAKDRLDDVLTVLRHVTPDLCVVCMRYIKMADKVNFAATLSKCQNRHVGTDLLKYMVGND